MSWVFQESDPMGGAAGEAYANTLKSPGMPPEHVLAREAIQNSVDAGIDSAKVLVRFRATAITGAAKAAFVGANTVNGPSPLSVSTSSAALTAATRVLKSLFATAVSTIVIDFSSARTDSPSAQIATKPIAKNFFMMPLN